MKKLIVFLIALTSSCAYAITPPPKGYPFWKRPEEDRRVEKFGQSFMFTRPTYRNLAAREGSYWHDFVNEKTGCTRFSAQAIGYYQQSRTSDAAARYFLINEKNELSVKGDNSPEFMNRDIRAEWLGLPNNYIGQFSFNPRQKQGAVLLELNQDLKKFTCNWWLESLWIDIAMPIHHIKNNIGFSESSTQTFTTTPGTILEGFNRNGQRFGKIGGSHSESGVAEIQARIGTTFLACDGFQIAAYSGFSIPTAGHQNPEYLFNPFIGHNSHVAFITGATFQFPLNYHTLCELIALYFSIENMFFLRNHQKRSLDLKFKPYSRYLPLNSLDGRTNLYGIDILTQTVKVQPFNQVDLSAGFRFSAGWAELEIGYDLWAHGDEELILSHRFEEKYGIAGDGALTPEGKPATASNSTICMRADNDVDANNMPTFVAIRERDLDLLSGATRAAVVHRAHASFGIVHDQCRFALLAGFGAFVEIPQQNTALKNWGLWGKIGATF